MNVIGMALDDKMMKADDNRIKIYLVPSVAWATEAEWTAYLTADFDRRQLLKVAWRRRSGVRFSNFEALARAGCVSLADYPPDDQTILANAGKQREFDVSVETAIAAVDELPVNRQYGRETSLGIPYSGRFWTTRYLATHAEIVEWAKHCLGQESR